MEQCSTIRVKIRIEYHQYSIADPFKTSIVVFCQVRGFTPPIDWNKCTELFSKVILLNQQFRWSM